MTHTLWKTVPFILLLSGFGAAFACTTSGKSDTSCAAACGDTGDCGGVSCLAYCISLRDACDAKGQENAFSDWATCAPALQCQNGEYVALTCDLQAIEVLACGGATPASTAVTTASGSGGGVVIVNSSGGAASGSGTGVATVSESSGDSSATDDCTTAGCVAGETCVLTDGTAECVLDDADAGVDAGFDGSDGGDDASEDDAGF